jgi:hypothetical protein
MLATYDAVRALTGADGFDGSAAPATIADWPARTPTIAESLERFFPMAMLLKVGARGPAVHCSSNMDHRGRYLVSLYLVEDVQETPDGRVRQVAARNFVVPPAVPEEYEQRAELLAELDRGVAVSTGGEPPPFSLTQHLRPEERVRTGTLSMQDQIALVTVLASREGVAVMFSPTATWPRHPLVSNVANRIGCRIYRFSFGNIPRTVIRSFRFSRYDANGVSAPVGVSGSSFSQS